MSKDLQYYLDHPDEMPTDTKEIEALANAHIQSSLETGEQEVTIDRFVKPDEKEAPSTPEAKPEEKPAKAEEPKVEVKEPPKEEPPIVLAKDGKHVIPYAVLQGARDRAETAERVAREQAAELERLRTPGKKEEESTQILTEDELKALETEGQATLAKVLRAQQENLKALTAEVTSLRDHNEREIAQEAAEAKSSIQEAIDANTVLSTWQSDKDKTMWNEAARIDKILRESPKYSEVPYAERFTRVVELTAESMGIELPKPQVKEEPPKPRLTDEEIRAAAEAKLKAKPSTPKSLSDIPGGTPPAVDERDRVDQMSVAELGAKFMRMSKDELDAYVASL